MSHARSLDFTQGGTAHHRGAATPFLPALDHIAAAQPQHRAGTRLHAIPELTRLLTTGQVHAIAAAHLDPSAHPVRAILFDKSAAANWALAWHQDRTIAVRARHDVPGYGPWTVKQGIRHVAPPFAVIACMVTLRIHLDDVPADNAPLLIAPGSHRLGPGPGTRDRRRGRTLRHPRLPGGARRRVGLCHPHPPRFRRGEEIGGGGSSRSIMRPRRCTHPSNG